MRNEFTEYFTAQYELLLNLFERVKNISDEKQNWAVCDKIVSTLENLNAYGKEFSDLSRQVFASAGKPYTPCNVLEKAINTNNINVVFAVFTKFLKTQSDRIKFFNEFTNAKEEKFNFHYFENDLSPGLRYKVHCFDDPDHAYKILQQTDNRSEEQRQREQIYFFIRNKLLQKTEGYSNGISSVGILNFHKVRHFDDDFRKMYVNIRGSETDGTFIWKKEEQKLSKITLRHSADEIWPERSVTIQNLDIGSDRTFAQQALKQIDFPELFSDMGKMLTHVGQALKIMQEDGDFHTLAAAIEQKGTTLELENREDKEVRGNAKNGLRYAGYHNPLNNKIVINGSCLNYDKPEELGIVLKHEAAHGVDHVDLKSDITDSGLYTLGVLAAIKNSSQNPQRAAIVAEIKKCYHADSFNREAMARINSMPINPDDKLLQNMKKFILWEARALARGEKAIVKRGRFSGLKIKHRLNIAQAGTDYAEAREALSEIRLFEAASFKMAQTLRTFIAKRALYDACLLSAYGAVPVAKMEDEVNQAFGHVFEDFNTLVKNKGCAKYDLPDDLYAHEEALTNGDYPIEIAVMLDWLEVCRDGKWNENYAGLFKIMQKRRDEAQQENNLQLKYAKQLLAVQPFKTAVLGGMRDSSDFRRFEISENNLSDESRSEAMDKLLNIYMDFINDKVCAAQVTQTAEEAAGKTGTKPMPVYSSGRASAAREPAERFSPRSLLTRKDKPER